MLPYPNQMPQGPMGAGPAGPVPPPGMGAPPEMDSQKLVLLFMSKLTDEEQKAAMTGIGFHELLKKMDLKRKQREGSDMGGAGQPMTPGGGNMAAPLAPMNRPLGM